MKKVLQIIHSLFFFLLLYADRSATMRGRTERELEVPQTNARKIS